MTDTLDRQTVERTETGLTGGTYDGYAYIGRRIEVVARDFYDADPDDVLGVLDDASEAIRDLCRRIDVMKRKIATLRAKQPTADFLEREILGPLLETAHAEAAEVE
jgi:hypothetical protein